MGSAQWLARSRALLVVVFLVFNLLLGLLYDLLLFPAVMSVGVLPLLPAEFWQLPWPPLICKAFNALRDTPFLLAERLQVVAAPAGVQPSHVCERFFAPVCRIGSATLAPLLFWLC